MVQTVVILVVGGQNGPNGISSLANPISTRNDCWSCLPLVGN